MANHLTKLSKEYNLPIVIIGKSFKPEVSLEEGSSSILVSQYCTCTFDDFSKPAIFLLAHSNKEYIFPKDSVVIDPWRKYESSILNK
jgi:hypothetical protein